MFVVVFGICVDFGGVDLVGVGIFLCGYFGVDLLCV